MDKIIRLDPVGTIEGFEESEFGQYVSASDFDAAQSELAALREERDQWCQMVGRICSTIPVSDVLASTGSIKESVDYFKSLHKRLTAAEQRNADRDAEIAAQVESALRRSFTLGQVYWQQADSDSTCQQNKSDQTMETQAQHILNVLKSISAALNPTESGASE